MAKTLSLRIERIGIVKFGDEKAMGKAIAAFSYLEGTIRKRGANFLAGPVTVA